MIFIYGGFDVVGTPAGEAIDPRRHVPFALVTTILAVMTIMTLAQIVAQGVLPDLAPHSTPIADAAAVFLGSAGALLVGAGSVVSMTGNNAGQVLSGSRMLFALAEHGELPAFFARIHPRFRTPANAVVFTSVVAVLLALSGSLAEARGRQRGGAAGHLRGRQRGDAPSACADSLRQSVPPPASSRRSARSCRSWRLRCRSASRQARRGSSCSAGWRRLRLARCLYRGSDRARCSAECVARLS